MKGRNAINRIEAIHEYCFHHSVTPPFIHSTDTTASSPGLILAAAYQFKSPTSILIWFSKLRQAASNIFTLRWTLYLSVTSVLFFPFFHPNRQIVDSGKIVVSHPIAIIGLFPFKSVFNGSI